MTGKWWKRLKLLLNFKKSIPLVFKLLKDYRVPLINKIMFLFFALGYFILPFDIIPDFLLPGIGYLDDVAVILFLMEKFIEAAPKVVVQELMNE